MLCQDEAQKGQSENCVTLEGVFVLFFLLFFFSHTDFRLLNGGYMHSKIMHKQIFYTLGVENSFVILPAPSQKSIIFIYY